MKRKGFTIIELLISISIIGVLASIVILEYGSLQVRARDTQRIKDLDKIKYALILYKQDNGTYPPNPPGTNILTGSVKYLEVLPKDPKLNTNYDYAVEPNLKASGVLKATLEDSANRPMNIVSSMILGVSCSGLNYCLQF